ncbi:MAG TPA: erythromycin esterase family protein, partial [Longimicrobiales bacterium]|nr:erythromycin esterase family protein [Longimicrobiales bacterium]
VRTEGRVHEEDLGAVCFVPLIGEGGWAAPPGAPVVTRAALLDVPAPAVESGEPPRPSIVERGDASLPVPPPPAPMRVRSAPSDAGAVAILRESLEPVEDPDTSDVGSFVERVADARVVLIGESTHGTSEFYRMRAHLTRTLIESHGFDIVSIEGDWPDAARVHRWVRNEEEDASWTPFARFPRWMWRNRETADFIEWLRAWNAARAPDARAGFYGLDLYSLHRSTEAVLGYLERIDPDAALVARERYGCLTPWQADPATYGRAVLSRRHRLCQAEVVAMLKHLLARRLEYVERDGDRFLDALHNARLVVDAEAYYRVMYEGGPASWNLRDRHMFETLVALLDWHGPDSRAVVWAHNSHVGDASATEMGAAGQTTLGELSRGHFGLRAFLVGQGTDHGLVAAARDWGGRMEHRPLRPSWPGSYEAVSHATDVPGFLVHLREPARQDLLDELLPPRLERAVGVVYRPETELQSHYFQASLPRQLDAWIWFDETLPVSVVPVRSGIPHGGFFARGGLDEA